MEASSSEDWTEWEGAADLEGEELVGEEEEYGSYEAYVPRGVRSDEPLPEDLFCSLDVSRAISDSGSNDSWHEAREGVVSTKSPSEGEYKSFVNETMEGSTVPVVSSEPVAPTARDDRMSSPFPEEIEDYEFDEFQDAKSSFSNLLEVSDSSVSALVERRTVSTPESKERSSDVHATGNDPPMVQDENTMKMTEDQMTSKGTQSIKAPITKRESFVMSAELLDVLRKDTSPKSEPVEQEVEDMPTALRHESCAKLLKVCLGKIEEATVIMSRVKTMGWLPEFLESEKGCSYVNSMLVIYFLVQLMRKHSNIQASHVYGRDFDSCKQTWRLVMESVTREFIGNSKSSIVKDLRAILRSEPPAETSDSQESISCFFTGLKTSQSRDLMIVWDNKTMIAPAANLWANCISTLPPEG